MRNLYTRRNQKPTDQPDVLIYDTTPAEFRAQVYDSVVHIFNENMGDTVITGQRVYKNARKTLCEELGVPFLKSPHKTVNQDLFDYFYYLDEADKCLDVIEAIFDALVTLVNEDIFAHGGLASFIKDAIDEINVSFCQHKLGYALRGGDRPKEKVIVLPNGNQAIELTKIEPVYAIRKDSEVAHSTMLTSALNLLLGKEFKGANEEFSRALDQFRFGYYPACILECCKSCESVFKVIMDKRGWTAKKDTFSGLLKELRDHQFFPSFVDSELGSLFAVLQVVEDARNQVAAHSQGIQTLNIDQETAAFIMHSAAANILYLANLEKKSP